MKKLIRTELQLIGKVEKFDDGSVKLTTRFNTPIEFNSLDAFLEHLEKESKEHKERVKRQTENMFKNW